MLASKIVMCSSVQKNNKQCIINNLSTQKENKIQRRSKLFNQLKQLMRLNSHPYERDEKSKELIEIETLTLEIDQINKRLDYIDIHY